MFLFVLYIFRKREFGKFGYLLKKCSHDINLGGKTFMFQFDLGFHIFFNFHSTQGTVSNLNICQSVSLSVFNPNKSVKESSTKKIEKKILSRIKNYAMQHLQKCQQLKTYPSKMHLKFNSYDQLMSSHLSKCHHMSV